jgi:hypothetical protein
VHPKYWDLLFSTDKSDFVVVSPSLFPEGPAKESIETNADGGFEIRASELNWDKVWSFLGTGLDQLSGSGIKKDSRKKATDSYKTYLNKALGGKSDEKFGLLVASFLVKLFGMSFHILFVVYFMIYGLCTCIKH